MYVHTMQSSIYFSQNDQFRISAYEFNGLKISVICSFVWWSLSNCNIYSHMETYNLSSTKLIRTIASFVIFTHVLIITIKASNTIMYTTIQLFHSYYQVHIIWWLDRPRWNSMDMWSAIFHLERHMMLFHVNI